LMYEVRVKTCDDKCGKRLTRALRQRSLSRLKEYVVGENEFELLLKPSLSVRVQMR
jgi:hypothetical protein